MSESPSPSSRELDPKALEAATEAFHNAFSEYDDSALVVAITAYLSALPTEASELEELRNALDDIVQAGVHALPHELRQIARDALSSTREPER